MKNPEIVINGELVKATKPKAILWRKIMEFDEEGSSLPVEAYLSAQAEILSIVFPKYTAEELLNLLDIDEISPLFHDVAKWVIYLVNSKTTLLPKKEENQAE